MVYIELKGELSYPIQPQDNSDSSRNYTNSSDTVGCGLSQAEDLPHGETPQLTFSAAVIVLAIVGQHLTSLLKIQNFTQLYFEIYR